MHILVTGGCGYKGSVLIPKLLQLGHKVDVIDTLWFGNSLGGCPQLTVYQDDIIHLEKLPAEYNVIYHLAAVANDPCAELSSKLAWETNALATMQLAELALKQKTPPQFIYASSGSVYGIQEDPNVTEEAELVPISDYNKTKMVSEQVLKSYMDRMDITIARPATVCGFSPRMRFDVVVNMLTIQALEKKFITVLGGEQYLPHVHIQDIIDFYIWCLYNRTVVKGQIFNLGFENMKVSNLALLVQDALVQHGYNSITIDTKPSNDIRSYRLSSQKLRSVGFLPKYNVYDAIMDIVYQYKYYSLSDNDCCHNIRWMKQCQK
jgi:nucleoside-diphosphate-sugar epimerase